VQYLLQQQRDADQQVEQRQLDVQELQHQQHEVASLGSAALHLAWYPVHCPPLFPSMHHAPHQQETLSVATLARDRIDQCPCWL
jgi:hypothetical protein